MLLSGNSNTAIKLISGDDTVDLDTRNRISLIEKFKLRIGKQCVLALTEWGSVCVYPTDVWNEKLEEILSYPANNPGKTKYIRMLFELCEDEAKCDGGRIVIPAKLREAGKLVDKVFIRGAGLRLELWNPDEYERFQADEDSYGSERRKKMDAAYAEMTGK